MVGVKRDCRQLITLLTACAEKCDEYTQNLVSKHHCVKPAQEVVLVSKNMITICRDHIKECKDVDCGEVCKACIKACEKVVEKATACVDVCMGAGSDQDAKEVCTDCAKACRDCMKACDDCMSKACS